MIKNARPCAALYACALVCVHGCSPEEFAYKAVAHLIRSPLHSLSWGWLDPSSVAVIHSPGLQCIVMFNRQCTLFATSGTAAQYAYGCLTRPWVFTYLCREVNRKFYILCTETYYLGNEFWLLYLEIRK